MVEKNLVINNRTLTYKGVFLVHELFKTINDTLTNLNYQKIEKETKETVYPSGKNTYVELRPFKIKTNYVTLRIKIKIHLENIIEVTKQVDGVPKKFHQGNVRIVFDAWSMTDYASRWGMKPWFFFFKAFINKYIYHFPLEESFIGELKSDTNHLTEQINAFLNLYKYQISGEDTEIKTELSEEVNLEETSEEK